MDSGEDLTINQVPQYPRKEENRNRSRKPKPGENEEEDESQGERNCPASGEPQIKNGHIDTRVAPPQGSNL